MSVFSDFGISSGAFTSLIFLYSGLLLLIFLIVAILFYLKGYGVYKMSQSLNIKGKWMSLVPVLNVAAYGRLADTVRQKNNNTLKNTVIGFFVLSVILNIVSFILFVPALTELLFAADTAVMSGTSLNPDIFNCFVSPFILFLISAFVYLLYKISSVVCAFNIFKAFSFKNRISFTVLSFIFPFLLPCFIFSVCKNEPYKE